MVDCGGAKLISADWESTFLNISFCFIALLVMRGVIVVGIMSSPS